MEIIQDRGNNKLTRCDQVSRFQVASSDRVVSLIIIIDTTTKAGDYYNWLNRKTNVSLFFLSPVAASSSSKGTETSRQINSCARIIIIRYEFTLRLESTIRVFAEGFPFGIKSTDNWTSRLKSSPDERYGRGGGS
jgi:hypothetical protein